MGEFAGALRERISIETRRNDRDVIAGPKLRWRYDGAAWASVTPAGFGDAVAGDSLSSLPQWQVTMRKREGIDLATRFVWRGRFLQVRAVFSDPRDPARMVVRCDEQR
jgi:head-tail adaptor